MGMQIEDSSASLESGKEVTVRKQPPKKGHLLFGVDDVPPPAYTVFLAFQQSMISLSCYLMFPFVIAEQMCAGRDTPKLRVSLIAATFFAGGIASFIQSTFGLRLAIIHGVSLAFLPPLFAWTNLPENKCTAGPEDFVPAEEWQGRLVTVAGSLLISSCVFIVIGAVGAVGFVSKHISPVTIVPLMVLLALSTVPTVAKQLGMHYMGVVELLILILFALRFEYTQVPIPYFSLKEKKLKVTHAPLFGQFPYLLAIGISWFICWLLTATGAINAESPASTNRKIISGLVEQAPWVKVPYPGEFGMPRVDIALCIGFAASAISAMIESVSSYKMSARVSQQGSPPRNNINRAVIVEGIGSLIAAALHVCTGATTYAESIALCHLTKVAARITVQIAGIMAACYGLFTKFAAFLACIPDPLIGGMLCLGMSMIAGVALSNLKVVNLNLTRNLGIMGLALLLGLAVPLHFESHPISSDYVTLNQVLNMLFSIKPLVGGSIAFILDNIMPGATRADRGLIDDASEDGPLDGFNLPDWMDRLINKAPFLRKLPFIPARSHLLQRRNA